MRYVVSEEPLIWLRCIWVALVEVFGNAHCIRIEIGIVCKCHLRKGTPMKHLLLISMAIISGSVAAQSGYQQSGNTRYYSNGQTAQQSGNTTYYSNGQTAQQSGNTTYYSNGQTAQQSGNTTYYSNGVTAQQSGNTTYYSNGKTCTQSGNTVYCN
jgi:hypothetical protein